ncbi:PREDICTED: uncharacterized protein LOC108764724 [Trachymyrmex cornetzi]|uniref:uncharacterized protein LOC108764724 n=1 Tax=Trachymyrmex cornetzi TaxID=471704 RepID=UPI00084F02DD|nr:PREDICTED: uncharacterized protein LOC108764724 [Trachymyrmex cornetzi]
MNIRKANGKVDWEPTIHSFICETHFANEMWKKVRIDGKRKLKCNAVPSIFPRSERSSTCITTKDDNNESLERQSEAMLETFHNHGNVKEEQHNCFKSDVPDVSPLTSNFAQSFTLNFSPELSNYLSTIPKEICNKEFDEVKYLKKKLEEANRKIESANKLLSKNYRTNNMLKKHIKKLTRNNFGNRNYAKLESAIKQIFTDDQIEALMRRSSRIHTWSNNTIRKALRLKISCGKISTGYQQLLKEKIPLPTERTLRRKLKSIEFGEGISKDSFKLLADKVAQFQDIKERDCMLALDKMAIAPGQKLDPSTQSYCGLASFCTRDGIK